jgi:hypothetical protein
MSDIRTWLDHRQLQSISFKCVALPGGADGIEILFPSASAAAEFENDFGCSEAWLRNRVP